MRIEINWYLGLSAISFALFAQWLYQMCPDELLSHVLRQQWLLISADLPTILTLILVLSIGQH